MVLTTSESGKVIVTDQKTIIAQKVDRKVETFHQPTDVLKTSIDIFTGYSTGVKNSSGNHYDNSRLYLALTYRFGNEKIRYEVLQRKQPRRKK